MAEEIHIGFHLRFGDREKIPLLKKLMKTVLKESGVTLIILELDKHFVFDLHPEVDGGERALTKEDAKDLQAFARSLGMDIVPLFQCLGHQGWGGSRSALLTAYPEFDETPDTPLEAEWPRIFCRSWCPNHPDVNGIVYDLLGEMIEAFTPNYVHIGMDEVYEIASEQCERCRGGDRAELFAKAVMDMHHYIKESCGVEVMMWGDRLINAEEFGYDNWEGDTFGTFKAIDMIPKDIVILDWHYDERDKGYPTPGYFMQKGFRVMPACWYKENVAEELFQQTASDATKNQLEEMYFGKLVTSWNHWDSEAFKSFITESLDADKQKELKELYSTLLHTKKY